MLEPDLNHLHPVPVKLCHVFMASSFPRSVPGHMPCIQRMKKPIANMFMRNISHMLVILLPL